MKKTYKRTLFFACVLLLSCFACKNGSTSNNPTVPPAVKETAKLKTLTIGDYGLSITEIENASKPEGFEKKFPSNTSSVKITAVAEDGGSVDFGTYSDTVTLTESIQTIIFKVKKEGKNDGTYTLKLSKEKATSPTPTETAKLKTLTIGDYSASPTEIENASKPEGFEKKFPADTSSVKIVPVAEDGGSVDFGTYSNTVTLTENIQTIIFKVKKEGKNDGTYTLKLSKEKTIPPTPQELKNLTATDFMGTLPQDVEYNVINSNVTWEAFDGATHYEVFIDDERTNDVDNDGKLTKTKFKTAEGLVDLDEKMGESEKSVKITVKALDDNEQVLASSSITKTLPKKSAIKNITFNDTPYTKDMKVKNPLNIKIEFTGNKIRFAGNSSKFEPYVKSYLVIEQGTDTILSNYAYDEASNIITISPQAGLNETKNYKFTIKKGFSDFFNMNYEKEEKTYSFKIEKSTEPALPPDVLKVLINDDSNLDIKDSEKTGINVESTVSIYFNQLIDTESYTAATEGESGNKGDGIYITNKETGKGFDESRLTEKKFETITENGKPITKATFKMVGKLGFYSTEPLKGNTAYYIVIDDVLKTAGNVKFQEKRFKFQTGAEKPVMHSFEVQGGIIVGKTDEPRNKTDLKAGDLVTIQAVIPAGKTFKCWNIGTYATLTDEQKTANPMTFTMLNEDVTIYATFE